MEDFFIVCQSKDICYCGNPECVWVECSRHSVNVPPKGMYSFAFLDCKKKYDKENNNK